MELQFFLFVPQTTFVGIHAPEMAGLRVLVFGEGWGAILTTLVGACIHTFPYEYADVTALDATPEFVSLKHNSLSQPVL